MATAEVNGVQLLWITSALTGLLPTTRWTTSSPGLTTPTLPGSMRCSSPFTTWPSTPSITQKISIAVCRWAPVGLMPPGR